MMRSRSIVFPLPAAYSKIFSPSVSRLRASLKAPSSICFLASLLMLLTLLTKLSECYSWYMSHERVYAFKSERVR